MLRRPLFADIQNTIFLHWPEKNVSNASTFCPKYDASVILTLLGLSQMKMRPNLLSIILTIDDLPAT